jgi:hypothetical protein
VPKHLQRLGHPIVNMRIIGIATEALPAHRWLAKSPFGCHCQTPNYVGGDRRPMTFWIIGLASRGAHDRRASRRIVAYAAKLHDCQPAAQGRALPAT